MAEELVSNLGYDTLQSDTKRQKLLECILTGNSKLYLGKVYTEEQLAKVSEEEVEKLCASSWLFNVRQNDIKDDSSLCSKV